MNKANNVIIMIVISSMLFLSPAIASADKTDKLIQLLIDKKIITADETGSLLEALEDGGKNSSDVKTVLSSKTFAELAEGDIQVKFDKGAVIKTTGNKYSLKPNARFHGLFTYDNPDNSTSLSTFHIRRARILAGGNVFFPWLKYGTQITLEGGSAAMRDAYMEAAYLNWMIPRFG